MDSIIITLRRVRSRVRMILIVVWCVLSVSVTRLVWGPRLPLWTYKFELFISVIRALYPVIKGAPEEFLPRFREKFKKVARDKHHRDTSYSAVSIPRAEEVEGSEYDASVMPPMQAEWIYPHQLDLKDVASDTSPIMLYLHGGAYCIGSPRSHRRIASLIALTMNGRVLTIDYRLAPEHPYPAAIKDALSAYVYLTQTLRVSPSRVVVGGDSAGGGLTLSMMIWMRDHHPGITLPAAAVCLSPWGDLSNSSKSWVSNEHHDYLGSAEGARMWAHAYAQDTPLTAPYVSPVHGSFQGLPPVLVQAGGAEVLVDDARWIERNALRDGVRCVLEVYHDMIHVFQMFNAMHSSGRTAIESIGSFVRETIDSGGSSATEVHCKSNTRAKF